MLLDAFPKHVSNDCMCVHEMQDVTHEFNHLSKRFGFDSGAVAAADMKDCFRHFLCPDGLDMWNSLARYGAQRHVSGVSVRAGRTIKGRAW